MVLKKLQANDMRIVKAYFGDAHTLAYDDLNSDFFEFNDRKDNIYYLIMNDENEYIGCTRLNRLDRTYQTAEFEIYVKDSGRTRGYAWFGMLETLNIVFNELNLEKVYWKVKKSNKQAIRFFKKHGFNTLDQDIPKDILEKYSSIDGFIWFAVLKGDDYSNAALSRGTIANCKIIKIRTIPTIEAGELSFFEANHDIPFDIKRIYYISKVPEGVRRGFHAHKKLQQVLFCPYGKIQLVLENQDKREELTLSDPSIGVVIAKPIWREMLWLQKDSVLAVAASDYYDPNDYIRDYNEFKSYIAKGESN